MAGRKIAIVGTASSTVEQAPVGQEGWEIWLCSPWFVGRIEDTAFDRYFELHAYSCMTKGEQKDFLGWLEKSGKPVYTFDDLKIPNQVRYPRKEVEASLTAQGFFTSTVAWMQALAIWEHSQGQIVERINISGVDMSTDGEYAAQKPGCLHFISVARMVGIQVEIPVRSELHKVSPSYPDGHESPFIREVDLKLAYAEDALEKINEAIDVLMRDRHNHLGQLEVLRALKRTVVG